MFSTYLLAFLILVPIGGYWFARRRCPKYVFRVVGIAFGAIVSPWATGLYAFYFMSPWGIVLGLVGLVLGLVHGVPGFELGHYFGLIPYGVVSDIRSQLVMELLNGLVWGAIYGLVGWAIDTIRLRRDL
jgi:hypothetical protein